MTSIQNHLRVFMLALLLSGITAFPIRSELHWLNDYACYFPNPLQDWIRFLHDTVKSSNDVLLYGTDWLAFAHIVICLFFIPVYYQPQRYKANVVMGMFACLLIFPLAFVCGHIRHIPFFHQLIDCSFGLIGFLYLYYILRKINRLNPDSHATTTFPIH